MVKTEHQVQFRGDTRTYFGIWIVNILLTIVTLGIYSAWAKVRNQRYFSQNTLIDERRFDYHATGWQILKGRLIMAAAFAVFALLATQIPFMIFVGYLALFIALPWLANQSLAFNAHNNSFSGLRFGFTGTYWGAFKAFLLYPILALFTLYIASPFATRAHQRYVISGHRFGASPFSFSSKIGPFYKAFGIAMLWLLLIFGIGFVAVGGIDFFMQLVTMDPEDPESAEAFMRALFTLYALLFVAILPVGAIYTAYMRNAVYAGTLLEGGHTMQSTMTPMRLLWISFSNLSAIILTLGLATPWAKIRMARYFAASTTVTVAGTLDTVIKGNEAKVSAFGEAVAEFEGIDFGIQV